MAEETYKLEDLYENARAEFKDNDYDQDMMHEITDGTVPIYYYDILQYAVHNPNIGHHETEIEIEGSDIHKLIQIAIYELIEADLLEYIEELNKCARCDDLFEDEDSGDPDNEVCDVCFQQDDPLPDEDDFIEEIS